jgi:hypothetical protein
MTVKESKRWWFIKTKVDHEFCKHSFFIRFDFETEEISLLIGGLISKFLNHKSIGCEFYGQYYSQSIEMPMKNFYYMLFGGL